MPASQFEELGRSDVKGRLQSSFPKWHRNAPRQAVFADSICSGRTSRAYGRSSIIISVRARSQGAPVAGTAAYPGALPPFVTMVVARAAVKLTWDRTSMSGMSCVCLPRHESQARVKANRAFIKGPLSRLESRRSRSRGSVSVLGFEYVHAIPFHSGTSLRYICALSSDML
jgi:hypothetical protein